MALFGLHQLKNFLFFGYGSGSFEILLKTFYLNTDIKYANHAHFDFIEFAGELGIIGVAILFFVVFNCCKKINFKNLKNFYLSIFLITILSFDFSFHIYLIQLIFLILFSIDISKKKKFNLTI